MRQTALEQKWDTVWSCIVYAVWHCHISCVMLVPYHVWVMECNFSSFQFPSVTLCSSCSPMCTCGFDRVCTEPLSRVFSVGHWIAPPIPLPPEPVASSHTLCEFLREVWEELIRNIQTHQSNNVTWQTEIADPPKACNFECKLWQTHPHWRCSQPTFS